MHTWAKITTASPNPALGLSIPDRTMIGATVQLPAFDVTVTVTFSVKNPNPKVST